MLHVGNVVCAYFPKPAARNMFLESLAAIYKSRQAVYWRGVYLPIRTNGSLGAPFELPMSAVLERAPGEVGVRQIRF